MPRDIEPIKEALNTTQALYAVALGARADWEEASMQVTASIAQLQGDLEKQVADFQKGLKAKKEEVDKAEKELQDYQVKVKAELGIVIDLLAKPAGGHTHL